MKRSDLDLYAPFDLKLKAERIWEQVYAVAYVKKATDIADHPMNSTNSLTAAAEHFDRECGATARDIADSAKAEFLEFFTKD